MNAPRLLALSVSLSLSLSTIATTLPAQIGIKLTNGGTSTTQHYLEAKYSKSLVPQTGMTLEAWVTYDETTLSSGWRWPTIARLNPAAGQEAYWLRVQAAQSSSRVLAIGVRTSTGLRTANYSFAAGEFKKWTHVAAVFDGKAAILYVNGVEKARMTAVGPNLTDNGGVFRIGNGDTVAPIEAWNGEIDEVRLWPFARTPNEIQSTMNLALKSVPGLVSTWNLDFTPNDSSGSNSCVNINTPAYVLNTLRLVATSFGSTAFGTATKGCTKTPAAGATAHAKVGNLDFALTCVGAATGTGAKGFMWVGIGRLQSAVQLVGAAVWMDTTKAGVLLPVVADVNGLCRIPAPIPSSTPKGVTAYTQFFWNETGCPVPIFASTGLKVTLQ